MDKDQQVQKTIKLQSLR